MLACFYSYYQTLQHTWMNTCTTIKNEYFLTQNVIFQLSLDTYYWTAVNQFFVWGSLAGYFAITFTMYSNGMFLIFTSAFPFIGESNQLIYGGRKVEGASTLSPSHPVDPFTMGF